MNTRRAIVSILLCLPLLIACQKEEAPVNRTIIAYIAADNNLSADALNSIEDMKRGFSETGTRLLVFVALQNENPRLLEIHPHAEKVVRSYPELHAASATVFGEVVREIAPR